MYFLPFWYREEDQAGHFPHKELAGGEQALVEAHDTL